VHRPRPRCGVTPGEVTLLDRRDKAPGDTAVTENAVRGRTDLGGITEPPCPHPGLGEERAGQAGRGKEQAGGRDSEAAGGRHAVGARTTVGELLDQWFARGSTRWSPTTVRNLRTIIDKHLKPGLGDVLMGDLTTAMIDEFYEKLRVHGRFDGKPLAVGSVRRVHSTLHAALAQAARRSWVFENVAARASPPKGVQAEMRPPTAVEVARLLESVAESDGALHLYLTLAAITGARRGQLLALRWVDVDLVVGALSIQRAVVESPDGPVLVPTKTRRSYRVALDEASLGHFRAHHESVASSDNEDHFIFAADPDSVRP